MLWLAAYYPHFLLQYLRYRHQLEHYQFGIGVFAPTQLRLLACDQYAKEYGVMSGQSLTTAHTLAQEMIIFPYQTDESQQANDWLCQWSYQYSARVVPLTCAMAMATQAQSTIKQAPNSKAGQFSARQCLERMPDTLLLEVGSMTNLFGGLEALLAQYQAKASALGFDVYLAVAPEPLAAQLLARQSELMAASAESSKGVVKGASHVSIYQQNGSQRTEVKPTLGNAGNEPHRRAPVIALTLSEQRHLLSTVSVASLPLAPAILSSLLSMGIKQLSVLQGLPSDELGVRFGQKVQDLLLALSGKRPTVFEFYQQPEHYQQWLHLLHDVDYIQGILFPLGRMLTELEQYLRQRQKAILSLGLRLGYRSQSEPELELTLHYPFAEYRADRLLTLCRLQLERLVLVDSVVSLLVQVDEFVPLETHSESWLQEDKHQTQQHSLLAQLQAKLGQNKLLVMKSLPHLLPEKACQVSLFSHGQRQATSTTATQGNVASAHRLISAQSKAKAAMSDTADPRQVNHSLNSVREECAVAYNITDMTTCRPSWLLAKVKPVSASEVRLLKGPQRVREPWWQGSSETTLHTSRDYYLAEHQNGGLCWVYKTAAGLFLHGWFG